MIFLFVLFVSINPMKTLMATLNCDFFLPFFLFLSLQFGSKLFVGHKVCGERSHSGPEDVHKMSVSAALQVSKPS